MSKQERRERMPVSFELWRAYEEAFGGFARFHAEEGGLTIDYPKSNKEGSDKK